MDSGAATARIGNGFPGMGWFPIHPFRDPSADTELGQVPGFRANTATMRFSQIDRIVAVVPGRSLTAVRTLSLSEEYLRDHFPRFPVMPGVLMLEAAFQAAMYLIRIEEDFAHSMVVLEEARNIKFQGFVQPGDRLTITVEHHSLKEGSNRFRILGEIEGRTALTGLITIGRFNLADRQMGAPASDDHMRKEFRNQSRRLFSQLPAEGTSRN